ncbi:MAG: hypothetical protein ACRDFB_08180 [Rhabdochlamydiaceae bacterium]
MTHQYDTSRRVDPEKLIQYYSEFEKYPTRYPLYCARIDVLKVEGTTIFTEEFWNLSIGELAHVKVKVRYQINSPNDIEYEIVEGYGMGKKNRIWFEKSGDSANCHISMIPLEIIELFYSRTNGLFQRVQNYLAERDSHFLEGATIPYESGNICPHCKMGHLNITGAHENIEFDSGSASFRDFVCDSCGKKVTSFGRGMKE